MNKNNFISFGNKIIQYDKTFKNDKIQSIYNGITIYFFKKENYIKHAFLLTKKEGNIKTDALWKMKTIRKITSPCRSN